MKTSWIDILRSQGGFQGGCASLVFSSSRTIVVCDRKGTLQTFDIDKMTAIATRHLPAPTNLAVAIEKQRVVGIENGELVIWEAARLQPVQRIRCSRIGKINCLAFSQDGRYVAAGGVRGKESGVAVVWNASSGELVREIRKHERQVTTIHFYSQDGVFLTASGDLGFVTWDLESWKQLARKDEVVTKVTGFSLHTRFLATLSGQKRILLWETQIGSKRILGESSYTITSIAMSADARTVAVGDDSGRVAVWDCESESRVGEVAAHEGEVQDVRFAPDDQTLASCGADGVLRLWKLSRPGTRKASSVPRRSQAKERLTIQAHRRNLEHGCLYFSPNCKWVISAAQDKTIRGWDVNSGEKVFSISTRFDPTIAMSPDGARVAGQYAVQAVRIWDIPSKKVVHTIEDEELDGAYCLEYSPDGKLLAHSSSTALISIFDSHSFKLVKRFGGFSHRIPAIAFSPNSRYFATAGENYLILWDAQTWTEVARAPTSRPTCSVAFSRDGTSIFANTTREEIGQWSVPDLDEIRTLTHPRVMWLHVSPSGDILASSGDDTLIRLWDVESGNEKAVLRGHEGDVISLAFSPDGTMLASASRDKTIKLWDVSDV